MEYIKAKTIVTKQKDSVWFGEDYNMNIYKGCCHGCIYCDSRSDCYRIEDFDTVKIKENAIQIIENDLRSKTKSGVIGTGAMSDPYNPFEKEYQLTRQALELIERYGFGISIATKSALLTRDIDMLQKIKKQSPVLCKITITTYDEDLNKKIEPHVSSSVERFQAIKQLADAGIYCGILLMPMLPFLTDTKENIRNIIQEAKRQGAKFIYPSFGVTLRSNQMQYYFQQLEKLFPGLEEKYIKEYHCQYQCQSKNAKQLYTFFQEECERLGILYKMKDIVNAYKKSYEYQQLSLFPT